NLFTRTKNTMISLRNTCILHSCTLVTALMVKYMDTKLSQHEFFIYLFWLKNRMLEHVVNLYSAGNKLG
ncbi:hypothetical protein ACJX0J_034898, partial [Zea mays]